MTFATHRSTSPRHRLTSHRSSFPTRRHPTFKARVPPSPQCLAVRHRPRSPSRSQSHLVHYRTLDQMLLVLQFTLICPQSRSCSSACTASCMKGVTKPPCLMTKLSLTRLLVINDHARPVRWNSRLMGCFVCGAIGRAFPHLVARTVRSVMFFALKRMYSTVSYVAAETTVGLV